jgi:hypothetical protein
LIKKALTDLADGLQLSLTRSSTICYKDPTLRWDDMESYNFAWASLSINRAR